METAEATHRREKSIVRGSQGSAELATFSSPTEKDACANQQQVLARWMQCLMFGIGMFFIKRTSFHW